MFSPYSLYVFQANSPNTKEPHKLSPQTLHHAWFVTFYYVYTLNMSKMKRLRKKDNVFLQMRKAKNPLHEKIFASA